MNTLARVVHRFYDPEMPAGLRHVVLFVTISGPLLALALLLGDRAWIDPTALLWAALLLPLAAAAERFPLHLTHKTNINVGSAVYIVMILILPTSLPGVLAFVAAAVAQTLRRVDPVEGGFNVGQTTAYVAAGAAVYGVLASVDFGPAVGPFAGAGAIVVMAATMHLVNTGLVALVGALQLAVNPLRAWWTNLGLDFMPHFALSVIGLFAAYVTVDRPVLILFMIVPGLLVHNSVRQTIRLRVDTHEALASMVEVIELRDPYTGGHSRRVAALARILATRLGMTAEEADLIEQAARVHDIGKAAIDDQVLSNADALTDDEWDTMRQHPIHGANVIAHFAAYQNVADVVRHHHEAWDGSGYPDRLAGEAIPFGARIIAVADTFDALTSDRSYRAARTVDQALAILEHGAGRQWEPRIVDALRTYLRETHGEAPAHRPAARRSPDPGAISPAPLPQHPPRGAMAAAPAGHD